ncbi:MAG: ROK family transcriptional regulator [Spirochaetaceae bacterium]
MNITVVLEKIRLDGPISRASLSKSTGLSRSTCSNLVDQLISEGLVCETGKDLSSGGRKAILLRVNYEGGRAIGIKLMQNRIVGALVDLSSKIIKTSSKEFSHDFTEAELVEVLLDIVKSLIKYEKNNNNGKIFGIGVGLGGKINFEEGILIESSILKLKNVPIASLIEKQTGIPLFLENDVNAFTLGEKYFGVGQEFSNFLCVSLGRGIGAGVIIADDLYRGSHHLACEFGHMKISDATNIHKCNCGQSGCLEAYASNSAILGYYKEFTGCDVTIDDLISLAEKSDESALKAFVTAGTYLGIGMSTLMNLFDPETIIVSGEGAVYYDYMKEAVQSSLKENVVYGLSDEIEIKSVTYNDNLWIRGVATLVIKEVFRREI